MLACLTFEIAGVTGERGERFAPHVFGVFRVDVDALPECFFEVIVFCLPCYDLRICAF
jgi:hypothetical protein